MGEDILIAKLARCPVVTEINGSFSDEHGPNKTVIHKLINNILRYISNQSILHSDQIVTVTLNLKKMIQDELNISSEKIIVITNGANLKLFHPAQKNLSCERLGLPGDFNYICFVGSLVSYQGVEHIIQAAPSILATFPDTRFLIVGDGPMKNEWVQLSHGIKVLDKFIFTGKVPYEKIPLYINASEICVVYKKPFKSGFSPLKLYEYMACGKPVVASNVDGFEILEQLKAGSLVKPEDANELAKAIIKLLKDRQLREIMGRNGIEYVKTQSWEAVTRKVEKVCEGVISRYKK